MERTQADPVIAEVRAVWDRFAARADKLANFTEVTTEYRPK